jgi:hypothetical protein
MDLRERAVARIAAGESVALALSVAPSSVVKWTQRARGVVGRLFVYAIKRTPRQSPWRRGLRADMKKALGKPQGVVVVFRANRVLQ